MGGKVEERPGGELLSIEGNESLGLLEFMPLDWYPEYGSEVGS